MGVFQGKLPWLHDTSHPDYDEWMNMDTNYAQFCHGIATEMLFEGKEYHGTSTMRFCPNVTHANHHHCSLNSPIIGWLFL